MSNAAQTVPLRAACLAEAVRIIEIDGIDGLSLREVSRRLGVSHQAPYKHFQSREHLLTEIIAQAFDEFANHMESRSRASGVKDEMLALGLSYIEYALANPVKYRLMFASNLPDPETYPAMLDRSYRCFSLLKNSMAKLDYAKRSEVDAQVLERDAMLIWTLIHGLVTALTSDAITTMPISEETREDAVLHCLARIGTILRGEVPTVSSTAKLRRAMNTDFPLLVRWKGE